MELQFPEGSLTKSMSDEIQESFYEKMKPVIWHLLVQPPDRGKGYFCGSAFCVDSNRKLLATAAHLFEDYLCDKTKAKKAVLQDIPVLGRRDLDEADKMVRCSIVDLWENVDIAIVRVNEEHLNSLRFADLDYVTLEECSQLKLGMEFYLIGIPRTQGFHFLRGVLSYEFNDDQTEYSSSVPVKKSKIHISSRQSKLYTDTGGIDHEMKYLQIETGSLNEVTGVSGSAVFNGKGKVVGLVCFTKYGCLYATSSKALNAVFTAAKCKIDDADSRKDHEDQARVEETLKSATVPSSSSRAEGKKEKKEKVKVQKGEEIEKGRKKDVTRNKNL